jgi:hypothetical protein
MSSCRVVNSLISSRRETVTIRYLFFSSLPHRTRGIIRERRTIGQGFHHLLIQQQQHHIPPKNNYFSSIYHDKFLPISSNNNRFYGNTCCISNNTIKGDAAIDNSQQRGNSKVGIIAEGDIIPPFLYYGIASMRLDYQ